MQPARKRRGTATGCNRSLCSLSTCPPVYIYLCLCLCACVRARARGPFLRLGCTFSRQVRSRGSLSFSSVIGPFNHPLRLLSPHRHPTFSFTPPPPPLSFSLARAVIDAREKTRIPSTLQASIPSRLSVSLKRNNSEFRVFDGARKRARDELFRPIEQSNG